MVAEVFPQYPQFFIEGQNALRLKPKWLNYRFTAVNINPLETYGHQVTATDAFDNCFWEFNLKTETLYWSDALCLLLGFEKAARPTFDQLTRLFQPEQNLRADFDRAIHQAVPFRLELPSLTANGKVVLVCTTAFPVYDDYGICVSVKGTLNIADEAKTTPNALNKKDLQQEKLENFARIVSHNLRSHTSNLQMVIDSVKHKNHCREMQEFISHIKTISQNLNQTVGYLNTLTKI